MRIALKHLRAMETIRLSIHVILRVLFMYNPAKSNVDTGISLAPASHALLSDQNLDPKP